MVEPSRPVLLLGRCCGLLLVAPASVAVAQPGVEINPTLIAHAVSADGQVVVGRSSGVGSAQRFARLWAAELPVRDIGPSGAWFSANPRGVVHDALTDFVQVALAQSDGVSAKQATVYRARLDGSMASWIDLPPIPRAGGTSSEQATVVTMAARSGFVLGTFMEFPGGQVSGYQRGAVWNGSHWTKLGAQQIGVDGQGRPIIGWHTVHGISGDGSVVCGTTRASSGPGAVDQPCIWVNGVGPQFITLPAGFIGGEATGVSADGHVVVGRLRDSTSVPQTFRWVRSGEAERITPVTGFGAGGTPAAVNADGSVVVGVAPGSAAYFWTVTGGMRSLQSVAMDLGIDYCAGGIGCSFNPVGVSGDGRTIVGYGGSSNDATKVLRLGPCFASASPPEDASACLHTPLTLHADAASDLPVTYQWQRELPTGSSIWVPISDGYVGYAADVVGSGTSTLQLTPVTINAEGRYRCVFSTTCGSLASDVATVRICAADINCSGSLSVQDIFDFLAAYFEQAPGGDFNGVNGHTVQDIFDFLAAYFAGCA